MKSLTTLRICLGTRTYVFFQNPRRLPQLFQFCMHGAFHCHQDNKMSGLNDEEKRVSIEAFMALGVCKELAEAAAGLGWKKPSAIQEQAIPHLLNGEHER
jgi:hypothetical protein